MRSTAALPRVEARCSRADRSCEEVLAKQPARTGEHHWLKVEKRDISTGQVRSAIARSAGIDQEQIACAGNRDRHGRCVQWFSVPMELVDHPGPLRRAGVAGKMRVLELTASHKSVSAETVSRLTWTCTLRKGKAADGYQRAKAIMDRLRQCGIPNYFPGHPNDDGSHAKWGRDLLLGKRSGGGAADRIGRGRCLRAIQEALFNHYVSARTEDGLLDQVILGDVMRDGVGRLQVVEDVEHAQRRITAWEAVVNGPLFGTGMEPANADAATREVQVLLDAELTPEQVVSLHGGRRGIRVQPAKAVVDVRDQDIVIGCELPCDSGVEILLDEFLKPDEADA